MAAILSGFGVLINSQRHNPCSTIDNINDDPLPVTIDSDHTLLCFIVVRYSVDLLISFKVASLPLGQSILQI